MTSFKWPADGAGAASGDVNGPGGATDNAVARFDGTGGKTLQNSLVTVDDSGNIVTPGTVDGRDVSTDGAALDSHIANLANPHAVTKTQVGLGNVDNTSDVNKPVSTAQAAADALKIDLTQKGAANGVATLDGSGLIPSSQLPPVAITDTFVVASQAAQTALTAEIGDVAVRTDLNKSYILRASPASTFSNWQELLTPTDSVLSVNGYTGTVSLAMTDITGTLAINKGGTGQTTKGPAFDALSPMTSVGDIIYGGTSGAGTRLAPNSTTTRKFLAETGTGSVGQAPVWVDLAGTVPGNTTGTITAGYLGYTSVTSATGVAPGATTAQKNIASVLLQPGTYRISGAATLTLGTMTGATSLFVNLSLTSASGTPINNRTSGYINPNTIGTLSAGPGTVVSPTVATTYYLNVRVDYGAVGTATLAGDIEVTVVG